MNEALEITIGFEGQRRDVDDLAFDLFEAGMLKQGMSNQTPGNTTIVLKAMPMAKAAFVHAVIEIALFAGKNIAIPLFVSWLYDKWRRQGKKPISIVINNHYYQFDESVMAKAIEDAIRKELEGKTD